jgi:hypothetical protein
MEKEDSNDRTGPREDIKTTLEPKTGNPQESE